MLSAAHPDDAAPSRERLELVLLGTPRLQRGDARHVLERRDAALLAVLAIDGPTPRGRLVQLLWPDSDAQRGGNSLRQRLFRLKRWAGADVASGERLLALAGGVAHDLAQAALPPVVGPAPELLGGHAYGQDGDLGEWVEKARGRWRAEHRQALADLAGRLEREGDYAAALVPAARLIWEEPATEEAHRRVMRLHYLRGDRAAALAAYAHCRRLLEQELRAEPGAETRRLADTIEQSGPLHVQAVPVDRREPLPTTLRRPPRLVGREAEWRQLQQALEAGCHVLLEGEPGIGKSRLLQDFARARQWLAPVGGRPGDEAVPHALAARWLASLPPDFSEALPAPERAVLADLLPGPAGMPAPVSGSFEPGRLVQTLRSALAAWRPAAAAASMDGLPGIAFDDLQFADSASIALLLELAGDADAGWCWCFAFRRDLEPTLLRQWRERRDAGGLVHLGLRPLDEAQVAVLLDSLRLPGLLAAEWAAPLLACCGGHPYYLLDALATLHVEGWRDYAAGPRLPMQRWQRHSSLSRRFEQLPGEARQLAHVAVVAGQDFGVELAAAVIGCSLVALAEPWQLLEQTGLFRGTGFAHDLVRQALLPAVPQAVACGLHRQMAAWLEANGAPALPNAARIAAHWDAGEAWSDAARCWGEAAAQARARSARREEVQALDAAARSHRLSLAPGSADLAFDCEWSAAHLLLALDSTERVLDRIERLMAMATTPRRHAAALEARARVRAERYEGEAAYADATAAAALAVEAGAPRLQVLAAQRLSVALLRLSRPDEAVAAQAAWTDRLEPLTPEERLIWLSDYATALDYVDRRTEAVAVFDRVVAEASGRGDLTAASEAAGNRAIALMYLNRLADSTEAARQAIDFGRRAGAELGNVLIDEMTLAGNLRDLGQFDAYLDRAETLPQALRDIGYRVWAANAENDLAVCFLWLGRLELARRVLTPVADDDPPVMRASRLFTQARLVRGRPLAPGEPDAAARVREAHALIAAAGGSGRSYVRLKVALELARDDVSPGVADRVAALEAEALEREQFTLAQQAMMLRTELLMRAGTADAAAEAARTFMAGCERDGTPPSVYPPEAWWTIHRALRDIDPRNAARALQRARAWIDNVALPHVPAPFRQSFLDRNEINVAVLAAGRRERDH